MMTQPFLRAASLAVLLAAPPAWAQNAGQTGAVSPSTASAGSPNAIDRMFAKQATLGGMAEVRAGQLAENQAQSPDVKAFGQRMIADHTEAGRKLKSIVDAEGIDAPTDLDKAGDKQVASLQKQDGKAFDRQYVKNELDAHKKAVALFQQEAASGSDPQLKQFAHDTLPALQHHLSDVEALPRS
jgi:putative membrane protein